MLADVINKQQDPAKGKRYNGKTGWEKERLIIWKVSLVLLQNNLIISSMNIWFFVLGDIEGQSWWLSNRISLDYQFHDDKDSIAEIRIRWQLHKVK